MPDVITDLFTALQAGVSQLPPVVIVISLLVGPTLAWLGYRAYVSPRTARPKGESGDLFWICHDCRSANQVRARRCYHCGLDRLRVTEPLRVVDRGAVVELKPDAPVAPAIAAMQRPAPDPGPVSDPEPVGDPEPAMAPTPDVAAVQEPVIVPAIVVPEPVVVREPVVEPAAVPEVHDVPVLPLVAVGPGFSPEDLPPPLAPLVATDLPELYWVCTDCRLPNERDDERCRGCGRERTGAGAGSTLRVVGGIAVVDVEADPPADALLAEPVAPKATRSRRSTGSTTTKRRPTRRDAAS